MLDRYPPGPHFETNEEGKRYEHPGYIERVCSRCGRRFPVVNEWIVPHEVNLRLSGLREDETRRTGMILWHCLDEDAQRCLRRLMPRGWRPPPPYPVVAADLETQEEIGQMMRLPPNAHQLQGGRIDGP